MLELYRKLANLEGKSREEWRKLRRVYLAQCAKVDAMFEAVCNALKEQGMYDDAAIFFLSDHGDFAGDYHMAEKSQNTFEDVLTRVPLLIKPPKRKDADGKELYPCDPGIAGGVVELVDFFATAMEYAGVEPTEDHFGRSLQPVIADRSVRIRAYAHCEGGRRPGEEQCDEWHSEPPVPGKDAYWAKKTAQLDDEAHVKGTMVTDGHFKFVQRLNGKHELYCLDQDPYEGESLWRQRRKTRRECSQIPHCGRSWNGCRRNFSGGIRRPAMWCRGLMTAVSPRSGCGNFCGILCRGRWSRRSGSISERSIRIFEQPCNTWSVCS